MTFWHPHNHPWSFTADVLLVHQLLARDCSPRGYVRDRHHRCLLIPRGVHFSTGLIPEIIVPRGHAAPYLNPQSGVEAPFFTMGPFTSTDMLFPGAAGDLDLYTDMEISGLVQVGLLKPSITSTHDPHTASPASKVEPASSLKKRDRRDSPSRWRPVSMAAGSHEDLGKSEHERDAVRKRLHREIGAEHGQSVSRDLSYGLKCSRTIDADVSDEHPHPKQCRAERGRSHERRHPDSPEHPPPPSFLFTPAAPSRPIRGSVSVPSVDPNRGSSPSGKGVDIQVPIPMEALPSHSACRAVQSSGQLMNVQVGPILATSGLTAAQAEEIFLLSHEVQTLREKLALEFIELSHTEANFRMGAQATSHKYTVQERPYPSTGRRGEATQRTGEETWLHINSLLFRHTIDHQKFMVQLVNRSQEAIQALHERIWEVVCRVMESAGKSAVDGLGIALHLVDMLPTIPLQLAFNTVTAEPPGYTPKALTYASQRSINRGAMAILGEELTRDSTSANDQAMQAVGRVTATDTVSTKFATVEGTGDDRPGTNFSPHSPTYSPNCSPFRTHCC